MNSSEANGKPSVPSQRIVLCICTMKWETKTVAALCNMMTYNYFKGFHILEGCLIILSRNIAIRRALEKDPDFTHLMFLDDDMANFTVQMVESLVQEDKPIISALVTTRRPPYELVANFKDEKSEDIIKRIEKSAIVEVPHVGMAFTLIKREVIKAIMEETPSGPIWFNMDREERKNFELDRQSFVNKIVEYKKEDRDNNWLSCKLQQAITFGQQSHIGSNLCGEDVSFCRNAERFGFKSYIHCGIVVGHIGDKVFDVQTMIRERIISDVNKMDKDSPRDVSTLKLAGVHN